MLSKQIDWHCVHTDRTNLQLFRLGNMCDTRNPNPMLSFSTRIKHVMNFYLNSKSLVAFAIAIVPVSFGGNIHIENKKSPKSYTGIILVMFSANLRHLWKYISYHILTADTKVTKGIPQPKLKIRIQIEKGNKKNQKSESRLSHWVRHL